MGGRIVVFLTINLLFGVIGRFELFFQSHSGALLHWDAGGSAVALVVSCCWLTA